MSRKLPLVHGALHSLSRLLDFINRLDHVGVDWLRSLCICEPEITFVTYVSASFHSRPLYNLRLFARTSKAKSRNSGEIALALSSVCGIGCT